MKILFDAHCIHSPLTGIGRYAYELGVRLPKLNDIKKVCYYYDSKHHNNIHLTKKSSNFYYLKNLVGGLPFVPKIYSFIKNKKQKYDIRTYSKYLFHGPNYYLPEHSGPCITTFHDLSIFLWPEYHPETRVKYMQKEIPLALKRANVILTVSEFIRQEISTYFNWPLDKIVTTPLAASPDYHLRTSLEVTPILSQWGLSFGQYSLFVGTLDPRKNIDSLLTAYERMPQSIRQRTPLIITGFKGWKSKATLERIQKGEKEGWARYLGFVSQNDLPFLYAGARVFLYPSYYEGFGLPVLEAMASGIPVICSDQSSLPEVVGDPNNAALIHPEDHDALYNTLLRALEDDLWCNTLQQRGLQRAAHFSWDKTASNTVAAYKLAYNS